MKREYDVAPGEQNGGLYEKIMAVFLVLGLCLTRIATAAAQTFLVLAAVLGLYLWYKNGKKLFVSDEANKYIIVTCIFFFTTLFSAIGASNPGTIFSFALNDWFWRFLIFVLVAAFIRKRAYLENMLSAAIMVFAIDGMLSLYQFIAHKGNFRGYGFGGNALDLSAIVCMFVPVITVILLDHRFPALMKKTAMLGLLGAIAELFGGWSRGAWLVSFLLGAFSVFCFVRNKAKTVLIALLVFCCIGGTILALPHYTARLVTTFNTTTNGSNLARIWIWHSSIEMFKKAPVNGVGLGNWEQEYIAQGYRDLLKTKGRLPHAHNNFFQILAETGLIGTMGFLYFTFYFLYHSFRNWRLKSNPYDFLIFTTVLSMVVLFGSTHLTFALASVVRTFWFLLAVLLQLKQTDPELHGSQHA